MPGFLEVYGYYDTEREVWAIDVIYNHDPFYKDQLLTPLIANSSTAHIEPYDHRNSHFFPASRSLW